MKLIKGIIIAATILTIGQIRIKETTPNYKEEIYTITKGDTLYGIAEENAKENTSDYVEKIMARNNITTDLTPGQKIIIYK